jgi:subtilisin family serine protease
MWLGLQSVMHAQAAPGGPASRLVPADVQGRIKAAFLPLGLDPDARITVVATLAGEPVALAQETASRRLTRVEKDRIKAQRRGEQAIARPSLEAVGAEVVGAYQSAMNGLKVRISRRQLAALREVPGVVDVKPVTRYRLDNTRAVPRIQAPVAWDGPAGVHGEGIKIAIIDTGIDYTHANFGGPGTTSAYATADATDTLPADPTLFGPAARKVKGGFDFAGDAYDAGADDPANTIPHPDPNPLDCQANGHGSHVAGSAAGFGVTDARTTYTGPYDATTHSRSFVVGPGVAPKADLYALRVFGCEGSTDLVEEAIEWAIDNDMDVINMSLGSQFGTRDDSSAEAADNAARAGIVVVASAGNEGNVQYITGAPGASTRAISVAAGASTSTFPGATVVAGGATRLVQISNGITLPGPTAYSVYVLRTAAGGVSLGCNATTGAPDDWALPVNQANVPGKLVIVVRGTCGRVAKAIYGQQHGAAAVLMINNVDALPPFEGPITVNPDDHTLFTVTIPFFGARLSDRAALLSLNGQSATFTPATIPAGLADFTSSGPRNGDSLLKPDVTAPGVGITSTHVATGTEGQALSGTSMASPMVAGTAALVVQAHPRWRPWEVKAAIINSGRPSLLPDYLTRRAGSGVVSAAGAVLSSTIAFSDHRTTTINFGLEEFRSDLREWATIHLRNDSKRDVFFNVSVGNKAGSPHTLSLSDTHVRVPARGGTEITARLVVPAETAGDSSAFRDVAGLVTFTPTSSSMNGGYALRVPYYVVPRVSSQVTATLESKRLSPGDTGSVLLENRFSKIPATADFYAWGLESRRAPKIVGRVDLHSAGAQSFPVSGIGQLVVFAINTRKAWSSPSTQEFDVFVDANRDGTADFLVAALDFGLVTAGAFDGRIGVFIINLETDEIDVSPFLADARTDGSSILMPVPAEAIGITAANPRLEYTVLSFDLLSDDSDSFETSSPFNVFTNPISTGMFETVDPGDRIHVPFTIDAAEWAQFPALGLMVVTQDNKNGTDEANLVKVRVR